jgi:phage terminase large subunit-like protein
MELMAWQQRVLDGQLLFDGDGDFLHRMSMVSTARQNGKTVALTALVGWWLTEMPKHRGAPQTVLSTAHRLDLAVMLYDKLADILELRFGAKLMRSYGRNQVTMPDGSKWFIRAANASVGHGMSCDLIVADEIWDIGSHCHRRGSYCLLSARADHRCLALGQRQAQKQAPRCSVGVSRGCGL